MTAQIQLPNTPEIFAKVERRLAEAIHEEARARAEIENPENRSLGARAFLSSEIGRKASKVVDLRAIRRAMKDSHIVTVDTAFYWSLTNETATTGKPEIT